MKKNNKKLGGFRKTLSSVLLATSIFGCSLNLPEINWYEVDKKTLEEVEEYCSPVVNPKNISQLIWCWTWNEDNIGPILDLDQFWSPDYWQKAFETSISRKGDCEDIAILQLALWYQLTRNKGGLAIGNYNGKKHAEAFFDGIIYPENFQEEKIIQFDDIGSQIDKHRFRLH